MDIIDKLKVLNLCLGAMGQYAQEVANYKSETGLKSPGEMPDYKELKELLDAI